MPQVQDQSLNLLTCSPASYHCATAAPSPSQLPLTPNNPTKLIELPRFFVYSKTKRPILPQSPVVLLTL